MSSTLDILRTATREDDDDICVGWPDGFRVGFDPPAPQPGDAEYVHTILYDPAQFGEADYEQLLMEIQEYDRQDLVAGLQAAPEDLQWEMIPACNENLSIERQLMTETKQFQERGYVLEVDRLRFPRRRPPRLRRSDAAWHGFFANAVMADAIIKGCRKVCGKHRENAIFRSPKRNALTPILGRAHKNDFRRGTTVLVVHQQQLLAPRTFTQDCIAYPARPYTFKTALRKGRNESLRNWAFGRDEIINRMEREIEAWSGHLEEGVSMDGLVLWVAQRLALLRLQATDWELRENNWYVRSGTQWAERNARETKEAFAGEEIGKSMNDLEPDGGRGMFRMPSIRRPPDSARLDVMAILAGGIGLSDEAASRDEIVAKMNWSRNALGALAEWVSDLRRFHRATLKQPMIDLIHEMLTGEGYDLDELHAVGGDIWAAARLIRAQFSDEVWHEIVAAGQNCRGEEDQIEVSYRWNDDPIHPARFERRNDGIVIFGPLLTLNAASQRWWGRKAEIFRARRSLTI